MTHDLIDEFTSALQKEGVAYVVILRHSDSHVQVCDHLGPWTPMPGKTAKQEVEQIVLDFVGIDD